jgi:TonB-dependent starch-binding outer membrane protein SusC
MVKNPSKSILIKEYLKKTMLISGICCLLLTQGLFQVLAASSVNAYNIDNLQRIVITGTVTDSKNVPLPGVNVIEKGTINGAITDAKGNYSLSVASTSSVLIFSFVGYEQQEVTIGSQAIINVMLVESLTGLEEVVVVGYGTQRKEAVTGSVASMGGDKIRDVPSSNITQALQGRVSGVDMEQTSTKPGAEMQIRIRGTRSLTANNDPLLVLDGIPFAGSIGDINPNNIKSIDILKDAAATAIYGSRGANGVILVTTNKGLKGQKAQVTYNGYYGFKSILPNTP